MPHLHRVRYRGSPVCRWRVSRGSTGGGAAALRLRLSLCVYLHTNFDGIWRYFPVIRAESPSREPREIPAAVTSAGQKLSRGGREPFRRNPAGDGALRPREARSVRFGDDEGVFRENRRGK